MRRPALLALCLAVLAPALWSEARAQTRSPIGSDTRWTLAAVGDVIMNRRTAPLDHPAIRASTNSPTSSARPMPPS